MGRLFKVLGFIILLGVLTWIAAQNSHEVTINYFKDKPIPLLGHEKSPDGGTQARPLPVYLLVLGCGFFGALIAGLFLMGPQVRIIRENQELKRKIAEQREELDVLRSIPIGQGEEEEGVSQETIPTS
ncbi:MAG: LapA family protein [Candidatus Coatesbacteria bacterium]|nr:LapA family protein [Candidatus Coatesbacteria bacterium]